MLNFQQNPFEKNSAVYLCKTADQHFTARQTALLIDILTDRRMDRHKILQSRFAAKNNCESRSQNLKVVSLTQILSFNLVEVCLLLAVQQVLQQGQHQIYEYHRDLYINTIGLLVEATPDLLISQRDILLYKVVSFFLFVAKDLANC